MVFDRALLASAHELSTPTVSTAVVSAVELAEILDTVEWRCGPAALAPRNLHRSAVDARWHTSFVLATAHARPVGVLAMHRAKGVRFPSSVFDPGAVAPALFDDPARPARDYLLIGGVTELVSGAAVTADLGSATSDDVVAALADAGFRTAAEEYLVGAALYVRDEQVAAFRGRAGAACRRAAVPVGAFTTLSVPGPRAEDYVAMLKPSHRSVVRRDWRRLVELGIEAVEVPAGEVVPEAGPLVAAVQRRHGQVEPPELARFRLASWAAVPVGTRLAFVVRDEGGRLLAVSFGCHHHDVLEMYEIGLADQTEVRHLAYVEVLVYAPLRYAARTGCAQVHLGLGALVPKLLRGAVATDVWAVSAEGPP
jgi:hypothetical protein